MRLIATTLLVLALAVTWYAGEQHRSTCVSAGRTGCTVLPWDHGTAPHGQTLKLDCIGLAALARAAGKPTPAC